MATIPASAIVQVIPGVLAAGGIGLVLNGLMLTTSTRVPIGAVQPFSSAINVGNYFGQTSNEEAAAAVYFAGYANAPQLPGSILIAQYPINPVSAWLRGGNISALTIAQLQALSGTLNITIDGVPYSASISLATATSFSAAGEIIAQALGIHGVQDASIVGSISGTTLTVTSVNSGSIQVGSVLASGSAIAAGTYVTQFLSGTGGVGTYTVSPSQIVGSSPITAFSPAVQFDSVTGALIIYSGSTGTGSSITFATGSLSGSLLLTQSTGAVLSQGAAAATPSAFMNGIIGVTQNWASFFLAFDPDMILNGGGNTIKLAFSTWTSQQNNRYAFICHDPDASPTVTVPATSSMGYLIGPNGSNESGTCLIYEPAGSGTYLAAFISGAIACLDFDKTNGRTTFAFRSQAGIIATVTNQTIAANLLANGYNFYGAYATANQTFVFFYNGSISGPFTWLDTYVNQIWLSNQFQLDLVELLTQANSIPYNAAGNALIEASLLDTIDEALAFGMIRTGVTLSSLQVAEVNNAAGFAIDGILSTQGWYLLIGVTPPQVRQQRGSPPMTFWYMDGESVQQITLDSIVLL